MSQFEEKIKLMGYSIHGLGSVGHIEDIVVAKDQQGKKLGLRLLDALTHLGKEIGCYKVCRRCVYCEMRLTVVVHIGL